jgi:hypothetical protein
MLLFLFCFFKSSQLYTVVVDKVALQLDLQTHSIALNTVTPVHRDALVVPTICATMPAVQCYDAQQVWSV